MVKPKNILTELAEQFLPQMTPSERREALHALQRIIDAEFFNLAEEEAGKPDIACPECGSLDFVKRGKDAKGKQRYKCRDCERTFVGTAWKIFGTTKLDRDKWMRFAECHVYRLSLRTSAERCEVCLKTAFFMRHRILEAIHKHMPSFQVEAGCGAELDETFFRESFSGNHLQSEFQMPREAFRHSGKGYAGKKDEDKRKRGLNKGQICVLVGINDVGDIFYELAGRGPLTKARAMECLQGKIKAGAIISTDKAGAYRDVKRELDLACHNAFDATDHEINRINNLHSQLKKFMEGFQGVSTRRLANYLTWFKWEYSFKSGRTADEMSELVVKQVVQGTYDTTWREYKNTPYPFWEYWSKKSA